MPMNEEKRRALMNAVYEQYVEKQASEVSRGQDGLKETYSVEEVEAIVKQAAQIAMEHAEDESYASGCLDGMNLVVEKLAEEGAGGDPRKAYGNDEMAAQYHAGRLSDKVQQLVSAAKETNQMVEADGHGEEVAAEDDGAEAIDQPAVSGGAAPAEKMASEELESELLEALIKEAMEGEEGGGSNEAGPGMSVKPKGPGEAASSDDFGDMQGDLSPDTKRERDLSLGAILRAKAESKVQNAG